jgi:hypothetical protein
VFFVTYTGGEISGTNFVYKPKLKWLLGYRWAISLMNWPMIISGIVPD